MFGAKKVWQRIGCQGLGSMAALAFFALSVSAQPAPADKELATKAAAVVNGETITESEVKAALDEDSEQTLADALDGLIDELLVRQFLRKYVPPIDPDIVEKEIAGFRAEAKKNGITITQTDKQIRDDIVARLQYKGYLKSRITDPMAKKYYDDNKLYFDKVMVRASQILVKVKAEAAEADKQAALSKIQAVCLEVTTGKMPFAEAARKYSECSSKENGGDIGFIPLKFVMPEPFSRTAFAMKVDEISNVVATKFGYHIIKVTDRTKGEPSEFEPIKDQVREVCAQDGDLYQSVVNYMRKNSKIDIYMK